MADPTDLKGTHAREFTNHELLTLRIWFDVDQAGNDDLAEKLLNAGLMLEHYTSLLDNDASKRTPEEVTNQQQLAFAFQQVLNEANVFLAQHAVSNPTVGPNVPTAVAARLKAVEDTLTAVKNALNTHLASIQGNTQPLVP